MQAFRLQNFRGFRDTGWIQLKPLTLLVGANSTGKSSLLRFLPLLRQSMATETGVPFAWAKEGGVDLGTAQDVHRRGATEPMRVGVRIPIRGGFFKSANSGQSYTLDGIDTEYELTMGSKTPVGEVHELTIRGGKFHSTISVAKQHHQEDLLETHHKWIRTIIFHGGLIPHVITIDNAFITKINELVHSTVASKFEAPTNEQASFPPPTLSKHSLLLRALHHPQLEFREILEENVFPGQTVAMNDEELLGVQTELWHLLQALLLQELSISLHNWTSAIEYIGPARYPPMRYHRMWAERPGRLMPDGANLAVLFGGMSARDQQEFNSFLKEALGYSLSLKSGAGNAELTLTNAEGETFNIADLGFGLSQVLPVYLQAHLAQQNPNQSRSAASLFVVEQPELHLHPQLQAKLADLFVGMSVRSEHNTNPVPCFVETHSKALLERVGELIDEKAISREDVQVLLFEKDGKDCTVRATGFDDEGILLDWPVGFLSR